MKPEAKKKKAPVHMLTKTRSAADQWVTACGLVLDLAARRETVLAAEAALVTCKACRAKLQ